MTALLDEALACFERGELERSRSLCEQVLREEPSSVEAWQLLGTIACQRGEWQAARSSLERALELDPDNPATHCNLAYCLLALGDPESAQRHGRRAVVLAPNDADAHTNLARALEVVGRHEEALEHFRRAADLAPDNAFFHYNLARALHEHDPEAAEGLYRQALALAPGLAAAHANLGALLYRRGRWEAARASLLAALARGHEEPETLNNLGLVHHRLGDLFEGIENLRRAFDFYKQAIARAPDHPGLYHNFGLLLEDLGKLEWAAQCYEQACRRDETFAEAWRDYLWILLRLGELDKAQALAEHLLETPRDLRSTLPKIIETFLVTCDFAAREKAWARFREARERGLLPVTGLNRFFLAMNQDAPLAESEIASLHRAWGEAIEALCPPFAHPAPAGGEGRLRIGYLSPDFRKHSVGYFFRHLIRCHDKERFEIYCYANQHVKDEFTDAIRAAATQFRVVARLGDRELAARIREDGIHVLVDLAGHTHLSRLEALAYRPAPVQVAYLGYPNTTGLRRVDVRLSDPYADEDASLYTEALLRLPQSFLCFGAFSQRPLPPEPPCRRRGQVTFGSFNNLAKITPAAVRAWAAILKHCPGARLLLKAHGALSACVRQHLTEAFARCGVDPARLEFADRVPSTEDHLDFYNRVDVALDTFPYQGTTTTCEALWMGVPVVTLVGAPHRQRVSYSILRNLGLEETIAHTEEEYIETALRLARSPQALARLRREIPPRLRASILCDPPRFTRQFEEALRAAWQRYRARPAD